MPDSIPKVIIRCLVYNHEPYLRDCLEGFVMQKTNFPFKAVVHDDASTDNSAAIIREYAEKYPDIIEPIYEKENQYSKHDGSLRKILDLATLKQNPYVAYCEGDDYWIDPYKLQKQVDFMDSHPECSMTCSNAKVLKRDGWMSLKEKKRLDWFHHDESKFLTAADFLFNSGYTCTLLLKAEILKKYSEEGIKCVWADFALKIFAAIHGTVYCFSEETAAYRALSLGSFTSRASTFSKERKVRIEMSLINTMEYLNDKSEHLYEDAFNARIYNHASNAILIDESLAPVLCKKYGYVLLKYGEKNYVEGNIIKYYLKRILWFPFKPGRFINVLKKKSLKQRFLLTCECIKSAYKYKNANQIKCQ